MTARVLATVLLLVAGLQGCAKRDGGSASPAAGAPSEADAGMAVDVAVMAFLSEARALHHEANVRESDDDTAGAIAALERLVHAARPHPEAHVPEVDEVLADTFARTAELRLRAGDIDGASQEIAEGLKLAPEPTYFRGHLLEVEGVVEEARVATFADAGKKDDAERARQRAIALLREAVDVQDKVIKASLPGAAREAGAP